MDIAVRILNGLFMIAMPIGLGIYLNTAHRAAPAPLSDRRRSLHRFPGAAHSVQPRGPKPHFGADGNRGGGSGSWAVDLGAALGPLGRTV